MAGSAIGREAAAARAIIESEAGGATSTTLTTRSNITTYLAPLNTHLRSGEGSRFLREVGATELQANLAAGFLSLLSGIAAAIEAEDEKSGAFTTAARNGVLQGLAGFHFFLYAGYLIGEWEKNSTLYRMISANIALRFLYALIKSTALVFIGAFGFGAGAALDSAIPPYPSTAIPFKLIFKELMPGFLGALYAASIAIEIIRRATGRTPAEFTNRDKALVYTAKILGLWLMNPISKASVGDSYTKATQGSAVNSTTFSLVIALLDVTERRIHEKFGLTPPTTITDEAATPIDYAGPDTSFYTGLGDHDGDHPLTGTAEEGALGIVTSTGTPATPASGTKPPSTANGTAHPTPLSLAAARAGRGNGGGGATAATTLLHHSLGGGGAAASNSAAADI